MISRKKLSSFVSLLIFIFLNLSFLSAQDNTVTISDKTELLDGKKYFLHTVEEGNTLVNIAKTYSVMLNDVLTANPFAIDGISKGMIIKVPVNKANSKYDKTKSAAQSMGEIIGSDKFWLGKDRISGSFNYTLGRMVFDEPKGVRKEFRNTLGASLKIRIIEEVSANFTVYKHLNPNAYQKWMADFFYSVKRFNWRPNTFSYGYENYSNNRYKDSPQTLLNKMKLGYFFLSYQHYLPEKILSKIRIDNTTNISITYFSRYAMHYFDKELQIHGDALNGKTTFGLSSRYTIFKNIYIEGGVYYYLDKKQQLPWDPDFTYGFGYFNWRPFKVSFTYGNWVTNRFSGKNPFLPSYGFPDGDFTVTFNYKW